MAPIHRAPKHARFKGGAGPPLPPGARSVRLGPNMRTTPLEQLSYERLVGLAGQRFRAGLAQNETIELKLVEVTPRRVHPVGGANPAAYESFSLIFACPPGRLLPQGMYPFECDQLGRFDLFSVPIGQDVFGCKYEAAFNRLAKQET